MYDYAMKYELCSKDYSQYVNIQKFKNKNPNKMDRTPFTEGEIQALWMQKDDIYAQIVLMLIYSGVRVSELLDLKREDVHIDEHCFNGITFFPQKPPYLLTIPIYWEIKLYRLQRLL